MRAIILLLALSRFAQAAGEGAPAPPPKPKPGNLAGRVLIAPAIPAPSCKVSIEGASADCNSSGAFILKQVEPGNYDLKVTAPGALDSTLPVAVGDGQTTWLGEVTVGIPGAVMGQIAAENSSDLDLTVIGIPELGLYTSPNITGGYLLTGVPAGTWTVTVFPPGQSAMTRSVPVLGGQPVRRIDFMIRAPIGPPR